MEEEQEWIMHYSRSHKMLLVGEGDFSFSACLARAFGSAKNMVSTSLDCRKTVMVKHPTAKANLEELKKLGCTILHEVDCHTMNKHSFLKATTFDRIIFNFPHAGFYYLWEHEQAQIKCLPRLHQNVVQGFFRSARDMLTTNGEVHVTHKTSHPFSKWEVEKLAKEAGLCLAKEVEFKIQDYPGYHNKRGDGNRSNESFPVGMCSTFKFILSIHTIPACTSLDAVACLWLDRYDPIWKPRS
ncbi:uncharacterized protein At4g26485-like [Telopea speciosissima]|uniref:uncharacterized protein At4g26485-like n=1 Tax=Telopea speciosissima TaxID=54955 RepID=UPI001CC3E0E5|nr:uncharacterized protein At4g26485-like [Telopea speciosissima]